MSIDLPALSVAAVPGRRLATIDLAREIEGRGFAGIYCPSSGDAMGLCHALAVTTDTISWFPPRLRAARCGRSRSSSRSSEPAMAGADAPRA